MAKPKQPVDNSENKEIVEPLEEYGRAKEETILVRTLELYTLVDAVHSYAAGKGRVY